MAGFGKRNRGECEGREVLTELIHVFCHRGNSSHTLKSIAEIIVTQVIMTPMILTCRDDGDFFYLRIFGAGNAICSSLFFYRSVGRSIGLSVGRSVLSHGKYQSQRLRVGEE